MKIRNMCLSILFAGTCGMANAQQTAVKSVASGHYFGAKQQFERFLDNASSSDKSVGEALALTLVCDYVLETPGIGERMDEWVEENQSSQYYDIIAALRLNQLAREGKVEELAELVHAPLSISSYPRNVIYPLSDLAEELYAYDKPINRMLGERLYDRSDYGRALPFLLQGEETRTSLYKTGMAYYYTGSYTDAARYLIQSAEHGNDEMAQNAWLHAGIANLQVGNKNEARLCFKNASTMNSNAAVREQSLYNYALTLHEQSGNSAVPVMEQFLNEYPSSKRATAVSQCLTSVYMTNKDYNKALSTINRVQDQNADTQSDKQKVLYNLAFRSFTANDFSQAIAYATQSIALGNLDAESYAESYYVKGDCNYRLGNYPQAISDLANAINLGAQTPSGALKNNAYAVYSLGYAQYKTKQYANAITQFKIVAALESTSAAMKADAYNRIGDSYLNMNNYDDAIEYYKMAKEANHSLGDYSMLQLAYIQGLRSNYDGKIAILDEMLTEYAGSSLAAQSLYEKGRVLVLQGKTDDACMVFRSVGMKYPQSEYAVKAHDEIEQIAANQAMQDSIAAAQDSIANEKAKAPVEAAQKLLEAGDLDAAEQRLNEAIDAGISKPYWLARAFILMSDIYRAQGRATEAQHTLESLKLNYKEDDDIAKMIEERLKK